MIVLQKLTLALSNRKSKHKFNSFRNKKQRLQWILRSFGIEKETPKSKQLKEWEVMVAPRLKQKRKQLKEYSKTPYDKRLNIIRFFTSMKLKINQNSKQKYNPKYNPSDFLKT